MLQVGATGINQTNQPSNRHEIVNTITKKEELVSFETLVIVYHTTQRHISDDSDVHSRASDDFKS
jgi:hypothetical protein